MTLNTKDPEAHRFPAGKATVEELLRIAARASAPLQGPFIDHAEYLYDERGLPE